jgi:hypothetical protein
MVSCLTSLLSLLMVNPFGIRTMIRAGRLFGTLLVSHTIVGHEWF